MGRDALCGLAAYVLLLTAPAAPAAEPAVTVESLLDRMIDLRWLAEPPRAGEREFQFSSYDRASKLVDGKLVHPFANADRGHYLRVEGRGERREWVLADTDGPGYVSRIWSANPDGELRIYIDGAETPALAAPFAAITNGEVAPFGPPLGHDAARGRNLYFPFPFRQHIKITTTRGDQYYQVNVTKVPDATRVESYSPAVLKRAESAIRRVRNLLGHPELYWSMPRQTMAQINVTIDPGTEKELARGEDVVPGSSGAITGIRLHVESPDRDAALARSLLTITFDGADEPQVAAPLGDFFGTGPGLNLFQTTVSQVGKDGTLATRWYMPFRTSARVKVKNQGRDPVRLRGVILVSPANLGRELLHFHARWKLEDDLSTIAANGTRDWRALTVKGAPGRFVGLLLDVFNPTGAWWGEGDEKVYVDGEPFPSTFGTGTEDYFGYAWGDPHRYSNPFHAQTRCDGPASRGNNSELRYQLLENIPWHRSFAFDLEVWHWQAVKIQYATLAYFYAGPHAAVRPGVPDLSGRVIHTPPPIYRAPGVIEGEALTVTAKTAGEVPNQEMLNFGDQWSGGAQLWWVCRTEGATLTLALPVEKAGRYDLSAAFTRAGDYGIARLALDGKPLGEPIDLYAPAPQVLHTGPVALGSAELDAGPHTLTVTMTGKNPRSTSYLFGMDWIKLSPSRVEGGS